MDKRKLYETIMKHVSREVRKALNEHAVRKSQFEDDDEIDIFSKDFYLIQRGGKYNLMNKKGEFVSERWFDSIEENDGNIEFRDEQHSKELSMPKDSTFDEVRDVIDKINSVKLPDFLKDMPVNFCEPFEMKVKDNERGVRLVKMIAKVQYKGNELLLDEDGKLYNLDGTPYTEPKVASHTDDAAHGSQYRYNEIDDETQKQRTRNYKDVCLFFNHVTQEKGLMNATFEDVLELDELCDYVHKKCDAMYPRQIDSYSGCHSSSILGYWLTEYEYGDVVYLNDNQDDCSDFFGMSNGLTLAAIKKHISESNPCILYVGIPVILNRPVTDSYDYKALEDYEGIIDLANEVWDDYKAMTHTKEYSYERDEYMEEYKHQRKFDVTAFRKCFDNACAKREDAKKATNKYHRLLVGPRSKKITADNVFQNATRDDIIALEELLHYTHTKVGQLFPEVIVERYAEDDT